MVYEGAVGGLKILEEGQPPAMIHATVDDMEKFREANPHARPGSTHAAGTTINLDYHGGVVADVTLNGSRFPLQSLWSNAFNSREGGCVLSYP